jgi:glycosyltransferase involved in cell wall biosynthesis
VKIAYLFCERDVPVLSSRGSCVHVREMCDAFGELGHDVTLLAGMAGEGSPQPLRWRLHELAPRGDPLPRAGGNDGPAVTARPSWSPRAVAADIARIPWWRAWSEYFARRARPLLEAERPDVIYERYVPGSLAGAQLARRLRVPLIVEMNASSTFPAEWWGTHSPLYPLAVRRRERALAERAAHVVVVSSRLRDHLRGLGIPAQKLSVLFNGVNAERFRPDPEAATRVRGRHGLEAGQPVVGFIGSLRPWHGVDLLLEAAAETPGPRLLIVGDGPQRPALEAAAAERGLAERAVFTGPVPRDQVPAHIAAMDVAVAPYPRLADFHFSPLKLFEYMAVGKPLVASRYPDIASVVEDGAAGLLIEPGDVRELSAAIQRLLRDPELAARLGARARRTVAAAHTWRRNAEAVTREAQRALAS